MHDWQTPCGSAGYNSHHVLMKRCTYSTNDVLLNVDGTETFSIFVVVTSLPSGWTADKYLPASYRARPKQRAWSVRREMAVVLQGSMHWPGGLPPLETVISSRNSQKWKMKASCHRLTQKHPAARVSANATSRPRPGRRDGGAILAGSAS